MKIQKISIEKCKNYYSKKLTTPETNKLSNQMSKTSMEFLPVVSVPLVAYMATVKKTMKNLAINKAIEQANHNKSNDVTWHEKQSRKTLNDQGITRKSDQNYYINDDGTLKQQDLNKYIKEHPVSHKGAPENIEVKPATLDKKIIGDSPKIYNEELSNGGINNPPESLFDPNDPDLMMDPKLEEIYNAPEINTPEGLLENIFGELPDGFSMDMNLLDTLKGLAKDVFKDVFGDLLG